MLNRTIGLLAVSFIALVLVTTSASAEILAYEGFATDATGSGANYLEGEFLSGYGSASSPAYVGPACARLGFVDTDPYFAAYSMSANVNVTTEVGSLTYSNFVTGDDGHASPFRVSGNAGTNNLSYRDMDFWGGFSGTEYYFAVLADFGSSPGGEIGFGYNGGSASTNRIAADSSGTVGFYGAGNSGQDYITDISTIGGGTHLFVVKYTDSGSTYGTWTLWIDPDLSSGDLPATHTATGSGIGFYTGMDVAAIGASGLQDSSTQFDEFYIATSASDFIIPEPATIALLTLGSLTVIRKRRK